MMFVFATLAFFASAQATKLCAPFAGEDWQTRNQCLRIEQILQQYPDQCDISSHLKTACAACGECSGDALENYYNGLVGRSKSLAPEGLDLDLSKNDWRTEMLNSINSVRRSAGQPPLRTNNRLHNAAQRHSEDMARHQFMSHTGSDGSTMGQRITATGYSFSRAGENVAMGQRDVSGVMNSWVNSPGHYNNLIGQFVEVGLGLARDSNGRNYWTQKFATPRSKMDDSFEDVGFAAWSDDVFQEDSFFGEPRQLPCCFDPRACSGVSAANCRARDEPHCPVCGACRLC
jgi:hypothetical protein